jgi:hypothetical protein
MLLTCIEKICLAAVATQHELNKIVHVWKLSMGDHTIVINAEIFLHMNSKWFFLEKRMDILIHVLLKQQ